MTLFGKLLHPSTLILVAANLVPLLGIVFWDWDAFLLLVLYWMETAIIGFWTMVMIAAAPREAAGSKAKRASRLFLIPFFIVHSGVFMGVHFLFLWELFAGDWARRVHNPIAFVSVIVIGAGLWVPLAALFVSRGFSVLLTAVGARLLPAWVSLAPGNEPVGDDNPLSEKRLLGGFYSRIIVMHLTILIGGFLAVALGTMGALMFMVLLKIAIDLKLHLTNDFPEKTKPQMA